MKDATKKDSTKKYVTKKDSTKKYATKKDATKNTTHKRCNTQKMQKDAKHTPYCGFGVYLLRMSFFAFLIFSQHNPHTAILEMFHYHL